MTPLSQFIASLPFDISDESQQVLQSLYDFLCNLAETNVSSANTTLDDWSTQYTRLAHTSSGHLEPYFLSIFDISPFVDVDRRLLAKTSGGVVSLVDVLVFFLRQFSAYIQTNIHTQFQAVRSIRKLVAEAVECFSYQQQSQFIRIMQYLQGVQTIQVLDMDAPINMFSFVKSKKQITPFAQIALSSFISFILLDVCQISHQTQCKRKQKVLLPEHLLHTIYHDTEYRQLFYGVKIRIVSSIDVHVLPYIHG